MSSDKIGDPGKNLPIPDDFRLAAIAESTDDAIIGKDLAGNVLAWNRGAERMFGFSAAEMIGQPITCIIPDSRIEEEAAILAQVRLGETVSHMTTERRRRDGAVIEVMLTISPIRDAAGEVVGISKIARDVTEVGRLQRELERREALFSAVLNTTPDALVVIDQTGIIQSTNPATTRLFGYEAEELRGRNVSLLMPEPYSSGHDGYIRNYLSTGIAKIIGIGRVIVGRRKSGAVFPMELKIAEARLGEELLFAGFIRDLTERQERERRIQDLQAELIHMSRVNDLGQMVSALAHEVNQPLTAMSNYASALRRLLAKDDVAQFPAVLDQMARQSARAGQIIQRIRDQVARRDARRSPESVRALIGEALGLSAQSLDAGLLLSVDVEPGISPIVVDKVQIQQVLVNLIRNAVEAMAGRPDRRLSVSAGPAGVMVEISITDTGPGLPEQVRDRLFQPFVTTKETGMGVGLSLCNSIVEAHGGRLTASDRPGGGTIFRLTVPTAAGIN